MTDVSKSQSLANRYRPQNFDEMIGQQHIIGILKAKMQSNTSSLQNYLLCGPRGTGKTTSARILAKAINCLDLQDGNPCNKCANCQLINEGKTTDYVEIDAASNTGVDNVREVIIDQIGYQPMVLKKKIYVIDEVHMLSNQAFNALLKTIEEPGSKVCFILATTELEKVPQTIVSRVQIFNFKKIPQHEMSSHLANICTKEGFEYEEDALNLISTISEGCVRDAVKYLDQVSVLGKISTGNVSQFLGISTDSTIKSFLDIIKTNDINQIFSYIDNLAQSVDLQQFAKQTIGFIDSHVLDDVNFYLNISGVLSEILRQIKFYPYPTVLYKMEFNKILGNTGNNQYAESKSDDSTKQKITSVPHNEQNNEKSDSFSDSKLNQNIPMNEVKNSSSSQSESLNSSTIINQPNIEENKKEESSAQPKSNNEIREQVIKKVQSTTLKGILKDHMTIESISNNEVILIFDNNPIAKMMVEKDIQKLEGLFTQELGKQVFITLKGMSKEEYFQKLMNL